MAIATLQKRDKKYLNAKNYNYEQVEQKLVEWGFKNFKVSMGFKVSTGQRILAISIRKDCENLELIKEELLAIMPIMKPNEDEFWAINIIERTQCEDKQYCIGYYPELEKWALITWKNGMYESRRFTLNKLLELINLKYYWQEEIDEEDSVEVFINGDWWKGEVLETKDEEALVKFEHDTKTKGWFPFSKIKHSW